MKTIQGYHLIKPEDLHWRLSTLMKTPNADYLERTGSENIGARPWRPPPGSANTLHKHIRAEEFYFVLDGTGRMRVPFMSSQLSRLATENEEIDGFSVSRNGSCFHPVCVVAESVMSNLCGSQKIHQPYNVLPNRDPLAGCSMPYCGSDVALSRPVCAGR